MRPSNEILLEVIGDLEGWFVSKTIETEESLVSFACIVFVQKENEIKEAECVE